MPSTLHVPTHIDANASLSSQTSMSWIFRPARASAFGIATVGARPVRSGATPADAHARTIASGSSPLASAVASSVMTIAAAPSLRPEELAAAGLKPPIAGWGAGGGGHAGRVVVPQGRQGGVEQA